MAREVRERAYDATEDLFAGSQIVGEVKLRRKTPNGKTMKHTFEHEFDGARDVDDADIAAHIAVMPSFTVDSGSKKRYGKKNETATDAVRAFSGPVAAQKFFPTIDVPALIGCDTMEEAETKVLQIAHETEPAGVRESVQ